MAKTKSYVKLWPFPLYFTFFWDRKWTLHWKHFPWVPRAHSYIFDINASSRMVLAKSDSCVFCPRPHNGYTSLTYICHLGKVLKTSRGGGSTFLGRGLLKSCSSFREGWSNREVSFSKVGHPVVSIGYKLNPNKKGRWGWFSPPPENQTVAIMK